MDEKPRAKTKEEVRMEFVESVRNIARYWAGRHMSREDMCEGVAFSILNIIDGTTMSLPSFNLVLSPHPSDKEFLQGEGENWYEDGMVINDDVMLHELFYKEHEMNGEIEVIFVLKNGDVLKRGRIYSFVPTDQNTSYFFNDKEYVVERSRIDIEGQVPRQTVKVRPLDENWESAWNS